MIHPRESITPGISRITVAEYDAIDAVRQSNLKMLERSPLHYRHAIDEERAAAATARVLGDEQPKDDKDREATIVGDASHCAIFEPERFETDYLVYPGKVRNGKEWEAWRAANITTGRVCLLQRQREKAARIGEAVRGNPRVADLLKYGKPEMTLQWVDEATGLPCKARADWLGPSLVGLKTARSIIPRDVGHAVMRYHYTLQWAFYRAGYIALTGDEKIPLREIFVESTEPRDVIVYRVTDEAIALGEFYRSAWMAQLASCIQQDMWPGMGHFAERDIELPKWAAQEDDDEPNIAGRKVA